MADLFAWGHQAVSFLRKRWSSKELIASSVLVMGVGYGFVGLTTHAYVVGFLYFVSAFFIVVFNVSRSSILQRAVPNSLLGRVGGVFRFLSFGISAVGIFLGGGLVGVSNLAFDCLCSLQLPYLLLSIVDIVCCVFLAIKLTDAQRDFNETDRI